MGHRNLLMAAYHFPPHGGSGVQRALKLARYLPIAGWNSHVLTAGHRHYPVLDPSLCEEQGPAIIHPVLGCEPGALAQRVTGFLAGSLTTDSRADAFEDRLYWRLDRWMAHLPLPELELLWVPRALRRARRIIREHSIEAIVTTSPPCATHLVGAWLRRRMEIPWIADLRDPILDNFSRQPSPRSNRYFRWMEQTVIRNADRVIVTCPELAERLRERYPDVATDRITTLTNGYDSADAPALSPVGPRGDFTLTHVGSLYRGQTIRPILDAIRRLRAARPDLRDKLILRLVGSLAASEKALIRTDDEAYLRHGGYVDHRSALTAMTEADALILTTPAMEGGRLCIPAKTFEYLAFGGHIIAFLHDSSWIARMIQQAGNCTMINTPDAASWAEGIESCFDAWTVGRLQQPRDTAAVENFRRDRLAMRFARVVEDGIDSAARFGMLQRRPRQEPVV